MNTKYLFGLFFIGLLVCSCKKELEPQESSVPMTPPAAAAQQPGGMAMQQPAANGQPVTVTPQQMQAQATPGQPAKVAAGMNPAHGQPGHRCDIPVGAPLNSPGAKTTAQTPASTTQAMRITPNGSATPAILNANPTAAAPVETKPGMNPPHGQPGHRCDIAVGAPLNSPPGKTAAAPTPVKVEPKTESSPSQFTVSEPAKTEEKKAE